MGTSTPVTTTLKDIMEDESLQDGRAYLTKHL